MSAMDFSRFEVGTSRKLLDVVTLVVTWFGFSLCHLRVLSCSSSVAALPRYEVGATESLDPQRDFGKNHCAARRAPMLWRSPVEDLPVQNIQKKKEWVLTTPAFQKLLAWLDQGEKSEGRTYLELRRRLVAYFDRKNCGTPDELADETLNRVARRLEEEGDIVSETPARYCYIVARFVFLEYLRQRNDEVSLDAENSLNARGQPVMPGTDDESLGRERLLACLDQCTERLEPAQRDLIIRYYYGEQRIKIDNRRILAAELRVSINALSIRACRIRDKLETCVKECASRP